jgi:protein-S-isoprenylcysteine O-methyltransferase Ste14
VAGDVPKKVPWDQRLAEHMARKSREAANDPKRQRNPPWREQIRSPYYWLSVLALGATVLIWSVVKPGWLYAFAAVLYCVGLLASVAARREARAAVLRRGTTNEK